MPAVNDNVSISEKSGPQGRRPVRINTDDPRSTDINHVI